MSDDTISTTHYRGPDGTRYRVRIVPDPDAASPRENDNATVIHTFDSHWLSPDRDNVNGRKSVSPLIPSEYIDHGVDMRYARRWVNLFGKAYGVLAIEGVERVQGGWGEGGLTIARNDDRAIGYVAVTAESWAATQGAETPLTGVPWMLDEYGKPDPESTRRTPSAAEIMAQDVAEYSRWAAGEYVGIIVERAVRWTREDADDEMVTWEELEDGALWGIDDEAYALTEAQSYLPEGSMPA